MLPHYVINITYRKNNRLTSSNLIYYEKIYRCEFIEQIYELYFMNKFIVIYYYKKKRKNKHKSQSI